MPTEPPTEQQLQKLMELVKGDGGHIINVPKEEEKEKEVAFLWDGDTPVSKDAVANIKNLVCAAIRTMDSRLKQELIRTVENEFDEEIENVADVVIMMLEENGVEEYRKEYLNGN